MYEYVPFRIINVCMYHLVARKLPPGKTSLTDRPHLYLSDVDPVRFPSLVGKRERYDGDGGDKYHGRHQERIHPARTPGVLVIQSFRVRQ